MACSCCDFGNTANRQFNAKRAEKELAGYRRGKLGPTTGLMRDAVVTTQPHARSVLDIGAGIGRLTFELLDRGFDRATMIDASHQYVAVATEEAERRRHAAAITMIEGDFVTIAAAVTPAEVVTLDRVVCCYEDYRGLLIAATAHASRAIALSFPRDRWFVRLGVRVENALRRLRGNEFRNYVHPPGEIYRLITGAGFHRIEERRTRTWAIEIYGRNG